MANEHHQEVINSMKVFFETDKPKVGIFWYDYVNKTLFGVMKDDAEKFDNDKGWITLPKLHKTYWQKQHYRALAKNDTDSIFYEESNYTLIPRGRVFLNDGQFYVAVGDWIHGNSGFEVSIEEFRELVSEEFNLPESFRFYVDHHWDIGHGWSEEVGIQLDGHILDENSSKEETKGYDPWN